MYETLVDYDETTSRKGSAAVAELLGRDADEFGELWRSGREARETGPLAEYLATLGIANEEVAHVVAVRRDATRAVMASPRPGAIETLRELHRRGLRLGLITVCSDDLPAVWAETAFAGLFDTEVFSCDVGLRKPDPAIYALASERLGVAPADCIFVGDAIWDRVTITVVPQVLELV